MSLEKNREEMPAGCFTVQNLSKFLSTPIYTRRGGMVTCVPGVF